ncbi:MAG: LysM peptidoglycan-binding domain-containing protein [Winogradskyella sp.]
MQKNYKLIVSIVALVIFSLGAFAQNDDVYKDVILDGKPAKLNVATGKITLVNSKVEEAVVSKTEKLDSVKSKTAKAVLDYHTFKYNETLLDISKQYGVSLTDLKKANNLETTLISARQILRVKNFESMRTTVAEDSSSVSLSSNFHVVEKGETLYSLAKRYNLDLQKLKTLNDLDTNTIKIGQKLRVKSFASHNSTTDSSIWTVLKGDTLYSISKQNGVTVAFLKQLNNLPSTTIFVGQTLKIK